MKDRYKVIFFAACIAAALIFVSGPVYAGSLPGVTVVASTIPSNGDVNPYGIAVVPESVGSLAKGNILVSNFNSIMNLQGTGTTIVQITPGGTVSLFAQINASSLPGPCPGGVGLTTALAVLRTGWVIVGSLPTTDGMSDTIGNGCLLVLDKDGNVVETFYGSLINGPWDMAAWDGGNSVDLFVSNVLNGTTAANGKVVQAGTVTRLELIVPRNGSKPQLHAITVIGSGFPESTNPAALVIGPTGLGLTANADMLYVADSLSNRVAAIPNPLTRLTSAGTGATLSQGGALNDPLGLTVAPNGNILAANGNNGYLVVISPEGSQVDKRLLDNTGTPPGSGALFGLVVVPGAGVYYVDDANNSLNLFTF